MPFENCRYAGQHIFENIVVCRHLILHKMKHNNVTGRFEHLWNGCD